MARKLRRKQISALSGMLYYPTFSYLARSFLAMASYFALSAFCHISPKRFATSPIVYDGLAAFTVALSSCEKKKKPDLKCKKVLSNSTAQMIYCQYKPILELGMSLYPGISLLRAFYSNTVMRFYKPLLRLSAHIMEGTLKTIGNAKS